MPKTLACTTPLVIMGLKYRLSCTLAMAAPGRHRQPGKPASPASQSPPPPPSRGPPRDQSEAEACAALEEPAGGPSPGETFRGEKGPGGSGRRGAGEGRCTAGGLPRRPGFPLGLQPGCGLQRAMASVWVGWSQPVMAHSPGTGQYLLHWRRPPCCSRHSPWGRWPVAQWGQHPNRDPARAWGPLQPYVDVPQSLWGRHDRHWHFWCHVSQWGAARWAARGTAARRGHSASLQPVTGAPGCMGGLGRALAWAFPWCSRRTPRSGFAPVGVDFLQINCDAIKIFPDISFYFLNNLLKYFIKASCSQRKYSNYYNSTNFCKREQNRTQYYHTSVYPRGVQLSCS